MIRVYACILLFSLFLLPTVSGQTFHSAPQEINVPNSNKGDKILISEVNALSLEDITMALASNQLHPVLREFDLKISDDPEKLAVAIRNETYSMDSLKELITTTDINRFNEIEGEIISLFY